MPEENNIKVYTASDIEKYWKGLLSQKEMNALEKAAMDDPFLADALEGYKYTQTADEDLAILVHQIDERTGKAAMVKTMSSPRLPWIRIAASIAVIAGVGYVASQLFFNKKDGVENEKVAISTPAKPESNPADTLNNIGLARVDSTNTFGRGDKLFKDTITVGNSSTYLTPLSTDVAVTDTVKNNSGELVVTGALQDRKTAPTYPPNTLPPAGVLNEEVAQSKSKGKAEAKDYFDTEAAKRQVQKKAVTDDKYGNYITRANSFNGRVVDANNNPVPFANVLNSRDNVGTYSDIRGNFNLVSTDTTLDLQVRALGYETLNYRANSNVVYNNVTLRDDLAARSSAPQAMNYKITPKPILDSTEYDEEDIAPEVGWNNYNTYLANNLNIANKERSLAREVQLSFTLDKTGQPTNIKITRSSSCKECDQEAIRALKEGPKWKASGKGKKGSKQTITIDLDNR